ncbi:PREDICTED: protein Tube-like, partial [Wasmannia auropunctata]|uniref:protein Tube-like n=1 Tax=Wasmannia auropunctata TaxID=64793 RepID=UPI0005EF41B4
LHDYSIIEQTALRDKRNAAQIFLDEWSTMERNRPTLKLLQELLTKAKLFRAADYVACDILKQERPKRPDYGPAASVDISDEAIDKLVHDKLMLLQNTFPDHLLECNANHKSAEEKHADDMPYGGSIQELSSEELPVPVIS